MGVDVKVCNVLLRFWWCVRYVRVMKAMYDM
jgi:hypothetical protein